MPAGGAPAYLSETMAVVVVTGASRGLGLALAKRFAAGGDTVYGLARNPERLAQAQAAHPDIEFAAVDVTDPEAVRNYFKGLAGVNVLINNAGTFTPHPIREEPEGFLEQVLRENVLSASYCTHAVLQGMIRRKAGTIVNICSIASVKGFATGGAYVASKHALLGYTRSLREELKPNGIGVIAILPGATLTSAWDGTGVDPTRIMDPEAVAALVHVAVQAGPGAVVEELLVRPALGDL